MSTFWDNFVFEVLFWAHLVIWLPVFVLPFVAPLKLVVLGVIAYEVHLTVFRGCILTKTQQKLGVLPPWLEYYTAISARIFNFRLTGNHVFYITKLTELYLLGFGVWLSK